MGVALASWGMRWSRHAGACGVIWNPVGSVAYLFRPFRPVRAGLQSAELTTLAVAVGSGFGDVYRVGTGEACGGRERLAGPLRARIEERVWVLEEGGPVWKPGRPLVRTFSWA